MEGDMVINKSILPIETAISFLNARNISFNLEESHHHGPFWSLKISFPDNIIAIVEGDIGFSISIIINGDHYELWQYDKLIHKLGETNKYNIEKQLSLLIDFLSL